MNLCEREECRNVFDAKDKKKRFCSRTCAAIINNKKFPKRAVEGSCVRCREAIKSSLTYCSECLDIVTKRRDDCCVDGCDAVRLDYSALCRVHYNNRMKGFMLLRYYDRRSEYVKEWGGKCIDCGNSDDLEFDHDDALTKEIAVGRLFAGYSDESIRAELEKCVLRCHDCHLIKTLREGDHRR